MIGTMKSWSLIVFVLLLAACGESAKVEERDEADIMAERIRAMEDSLFQNMAFDKRNAQMLLDVYKAYAAANPLDERSPEYLFRAAGVARSMKDPQQSIRLYDRILVDYPGWEKLPDVYYLKAFVIDSDLGHMGDAREAYRKVIALYPEHPFAQDARVMIENLEYTDEELIERFKKMQAEQEASGSAGD